MINPIAQTYIDRIEEACKRIKPKVAIHSLTYNHEHYIKEALDSFLMQKTDFPFIAIVHEDASTDGTAGILREYAEKYPDIIFPIFEKENQYSKKDGSIDDIMHAAIKASGAEYVAMCECDDYWTDPNKLLTQITFHKNNPEYGMSFHDVSYYDQSILKLRRRPCSYPKNQEVLTEDVIIGGGGFCPTCSVIYKFSLLKDYPEFASNYHVGDYPLQIFFSLVSRIYYMNSVMAVYRINSSSSWTANNNASKIGKKKALQVLEKSLKFLDNFDEFSNHRYHKIFEKRKNRNIYNSYLQLREYWHALKYLPLEGTEICRYLCYVLNLNKITSLIKGILYERKNQHQ